jgi:kynureninase
MKFESTLDFAKQLDEQDTLSHFRSLFYIPLNKEKKECIYFCGNSLGLQPKSVKQSIEQELSDWEKLGVKGHTEAKATPAKEEKKKD